MLKRRLSIRQLKPGMRLSRLVIVIRVYPCPDMDHIGFYHVFCAVFEPSTGRVEVEHEHQHGSNNIDIEIEEDDDDVDHH